MQQRRTGHQFFLWHRRLAIDQIGKIASSVDKIDIAIQCDVEDWLLPACTQLCIRSNPMKLGIREVIFIGPGEVRNLVQEMVFKLKSTYTYRRVINEKL
jgi:hypothetical protein